MSDGGIEGPQDSDTLRARVDWLERVVVRLGAFFAVWGLSWGAFAPWAVEADKRGEQTLRLGTLVFDMLSQSGGHSDEEVLFVISFAVFDLATLGAIALSLGALGRNRTATWIDKGCAALLWCCIAGAGLVTAMAAGRVDPGSTQDAVHVNAYATWTVGALAAIWVMTRTQGGRPTPRALHPASETTDSGEPSS